MEALCAYPTWQAGALLQGGKCRELLGQQKEALKLYARILEVYPQTSFAVRAKRRLAAAAPTPSAASREQGRQGSSE